ncbi:MAG TPA: DUF2461 domain-containing protein [Solirubrobacteraceae bacterium]
MPSTSFTGWPAAAFEFLRELEADNDRDWFKANRARYDALLRAPTLALAEDLAALGRPHLFRPFNDARFHAGPPIKEHVGLAIGMEGAGGYYVQISLDGLLIAAGLYNPQSDQVERLRTAVDDGRRGGALRRAVGTAQEAGLELGEPDLKRVPRGYATEHPRADLLRHRRMVVHRRVPLARWMSTRAASTRIASTLAASTPLVTWLRTNVGPSEKPRERR